METTQTIARILGPLYVVAAIAWVVNRKTYGKMIEELAAQQALLFLSAVLAFLFGAVILSLHNIWGNGWQITITLLGYAGLFKGLLLLLFPDFMIGLARSIASNTFIMRVTSALVLALGASLVWFGYLA
jgi:hypothetical protein